MKLPLSRRLKAVAVLAAFLFHGLLPLRAGVPQLMNYQGRATSGGKNVDGAALFKFSLVDAGVDQSVAATATAEVNGDGKVREIHITNPGSGYVTPPSVRIEGTGSGAGAVATSRLISFSVSGLDSPLIHWVRTGVLPVMSATYSAGRQ